MDDYEGFFSGVGEYRLKARYYDCRESFSVEELYQQFKARFLAEMTDIGEAEHG
jgi:hypothetical protein